MNRGTITFAILVGCTGTPPSSPPTPANKTSDPRPLVAVTTCYQQLDSKPDAKPGAKPDVVRRVLDPAHHTISVRYFPEGESPLPEDDFVVDGEHFKDAEPHREIHTEGQLVGDPWHWTSWTTTVTYKDGTTMVTATTATEAGFTAHKEIHFHSGSNATRDPVRFGKIECGALAVDKPEKRIDL